MRILLRDVRRARFAIREHHAIVSLKSQDVVVLLKLAAHHDDAWSYPALGVQLGMSSSEVLRELLITDTAAPAERPTDDVDAIVSISSRVEYYELANQLKSTRI
jgi:hypothetical protein